MLEIYNDIIKLFTIYDNFIILDLIKDFKCLEPPVLKRQICVKHEIQNDYNFLKMVNDSLDKKLFIIGKYNIETKEIYTFDKIGFEYSYNTMCRNLDIENPFYNDYDNYYILINTLSTIYSGDDNKNNNFDHINDYFSKKNKILLKKIYKKYKQLYEIMKLKDMFSEDENAFFELSIEKINVDK